MSRRALSVESFKVMDVLHRANELQADGHDVVHCEVGQPETGAPERVARAAVEALIEPQIMGYTDAFGLMALRQRISDHYDKKYKMEKSIPTNRVVVTTGSSGGFLLAFTACFDAGDFVAIASSGYPCYRNILSALGCNLVNISVNDSFKLTATELKQEIGARKANGDVAIKGLILSSPSNPTGAMLDSSELKDLCELCERNGIQFLSDEIYHGISYGKKESTALNYSDKALVINSFSKYYSMTGWRLGWMIIPENLIDPINALQQNMFISAPTISQTAAIKCWENDTIKELEQHVAKYRISRSVVLDELKKISDLDAKNIAPADGGFYIYLDLGERNVAPGFGSIALCKALLDEEHVAFTPGNDFEDPAGPLGDRRLRISYAGGVDTVKTAMERFRRFWPTWLQRVRAVQLSS